MVQLAPGDVLARLRRDAGRSVGRVRNGLRHVAGVGRPALGQSPRHEVWAAEKVRLFRYDSDQRTLRPPLLFVHSLVSRSYVFDLAPGNSFVEYMLHRGFDVFLIDWGEPDELEAGNTLETYCDGYLPEIVDVVRTLTASPDVTVFGYCFGGLLSLLYAAGHPDDPIRSLAVLATPVDFSKLGPMSQLLQEGRVDPEDVVADDGNVPADLVRRSFQVLSPTAEVTTYVNLWQHLWNPDYVSAHEAMTQWARDHIPFPGACFRQVAELFTRRNLLATGRVPLGDREVDLRDITVPFLSVLGEADTIVPAAATYGLPDLVGSTDATELRLPAGHVGLIIGKAAHTRNLPALAGWLEQHSERVAPAPQDSRDTG